MPVRGVGSKAYFELRRNEIQSIQRVGNKAVDIVNDEKNDEFSFKAIGAVIGKAFRELIECFTSEGRYEQKLKDRISSLRDKGFDNYNQKIDEFYDDQFQLLRKKAFEGFTTHLPKFDAIARKIVEDEGVKQAHPKLHELLDDAFSIRKTDACEAFIALPAVLDSIVIDDPETPMNELILSLKNEFEKDAETKTFLDKNVKDLQEGLNLKKNASSKLYQFLQPKDAHLTSVISNLDDWKKQMLKQRTDFLGELPKVEGDLLYYSFQSEQISRVKKILKLQKKEINGEDKLKSSLANFVADKILEKIETDKKKIKDSKKGLFVKFNKRRDDLEVEKRKAEEKLELANKQKKAAKAQEIQLRLDIIQSAQAFNDECCAILNNSIEKWLSPKDASLDERNDAFNDLCSNKSTTLEDFAKFQKELLLAPNHAQDAIDAMLAEAAYNLFHKEVENETDPKSLSENATPDEINEVRQRADRFLGVIREMEKEHFKPLLAKSKAANVDSDWAKEATEFLEKLTPELDILRKKYQDIVEQCKDANDPEIQKAKRETKISAPKAEELAKNDYAFLETLKVRFTHHPIKGDGNCFFHSCVMGLNSLAGPQDETAEFQALKAMDGFALRKALYAYIKVNGEKYNKKFALQVSGVIDDYVRLKDDEVELFLKQKVAEDFSTLYQQFRDSFINQALPEEKPEFSGYITEWIINNPVALEMYCDAMAKSTTFVDDFELTAFAQLAGVDIAIHTKDNTKGIYIINCKEKAHGVINLFKPSLAHYEYLEPKVKG